MKKEQKTYDITYDNKEKIKRLNADYFSYFQDIEKSLLKKSKNIVKTNILMSDILDEMIKHQETIHDPTLLLGKNKQTFIDKIDRKIKYKERIASIKNHDQIHYTIAGLWMTMCGYLVLLFVKELLSNHYLIHFYVDSLVAVVSLCIAIHNLSNEIATIKRYQLSMKPIIIEIVGFIVSFIVVFLMYAYPFDITFVILVAAFFTNKKIFEKELNQ